MTWVTAGAAGASLLSGIFGAKKQKKSQQELMNYQRSIRLDPVTGQFGGISVNDGNVDAGAFGGLQDAFSNAASGVLGNIDFSGNLPPEVAKALSMFQGNLSPNVNPMLGGLLRGQRQAGAVANQAAGDLLGGTPQSALMAQLFGGASSLAGDVGRSYNDVRDSTLSNLRAQALPEQQRAVQSALSGLFSQGRLGTTGGANILGRLSEAQDQQDLGFQLAAGNEARAASADTTNRFGALLSGGSDLLQQAFSRFTGATGLGANLNQAAYDRTSGLEQTGFDRLSQNLQAVTGLSSLPGQLQNQQVGLAGALTSGAGSIQDLINSAFNNALNKSTAGTNVRLAGAGLNTQVQTSPTYSASPVADAFGSFATGLAGSGGGQSLMNLFSSIFNRGKTAQPVAAGVWP